MAEEPETTDSMVAALLREREGYARRGLKDRVAQVDEQLKLRGYKPQRGGRQQKTAEADKTPADAQTTDQDQRAQPPQGRTQQAPEKT